MSMGGGSGLIDGLMDGGLGGVNIVRGCNRCELHPIMLGRGVGQCPDNFSHLLHEV